jgi:hypothetical protein
MSEGGTKAEDSGQLDVIEKWTHIHQIAIESLFGWKIDKTDSMNILHYMVCPDIDFGTKPRLTSISYRVHQYSCFFFFLCGL